MRHPRRTQPLQTFDSKIIIGNNVTATADLQIAAASEVTIEDEVMFASNIHINDSFHGYETANVRGHHWGTNDNRCKQRRNKEHSG